MTRLSSILTIAVVAFSSLAATADESSSITSLNDCHLHDTTQFCIAEPSGEEIAVRTIPSGTSDLPTEYTGCHDHGGELFCIDPSGEEIAIETHSEENGHDHSKEDHDHDEHAEETTTTASPTAEKQNCHFHAGVEHCTGGHGESVEQTCSKVDRNYNIPLRIGAIFIVLTTSAIAVFLPLVLKHFVKASSATIAFMIVKQFGTGVIIATAYVHLLTHANLMFMNTCVGELAYEGTASAIAMAGIFLAFLLEYGAHRFLESRKHHAVSNGVHPNAASDDMHSHDKRESTAEAESASASSSSIEAQHEVSVHCHDEEDKIAVGVMEAGVIFHSILIGITLIVAGDSVFGTLLVVIVFHQAFEGLALGTRIANLAPASGMNLTKAIMAGAFSFVTPIGMAIGLGVLKQFNGNDKSTIIAMGTLDALSAGILVWVAVAEMLCHDWMYGDLKNASLVKTLIALLSLISGMILMSVLGKWA